MTQPASTPPQALLPARIGRERFPVARGMRAGHWVFANGVLPARYGDPDRPWSAEPEPAVQARSLWQGLAEVLHAGGSDVTHMVRSDQFFPDWRAVPFFHEVRRQVCGRYVAPSTSVLMPGLLHPRAAVTTDAVAVAAGGPKVEAVYPHGLDVPSTSSFAPVARAGELVFVAGFMAAHQPGDLGGIAPEARVPDGHLWKGNRTQLEAEYLIRRKLEPALQGAGSSLDRVVKANVFLSDLAELPAFNQVWHRTFGPNVPATTYVQTSTPGFAIADARMEINLVAAAADAKIDRVSAVDGVLPPCEGIPLAVKAGGLLFLSGLVAADEGGVVAAARRDVDAPYLSSPIEAQMTWLLDGAQRICRAAGTSLSNVVRLHQYHTELHDLLLACRQWQHALGGQPLPISAVRTPAMPVPGCTVQLDLWVYAP